MFTAFGPNVSVRTASHRYDARGGLFDLRRDPVKPRTSHGNSPNWPNNWRTRWRGGKKKRGPAWFRPPRIVRSRSVIASSRGRRSRARRGRARRGTSQRTGAELLVLCELDEFGRPHHVGCGRAHLRRVRRGSALHLSAGGRAGARSGCPAGSRGSKGGWNRVGIRRCTQTRTRCRDRPPNRK